MAVSRVRDEESRDESYIMWQTLVDLRLQFSLDTQLEDNNNTHGEFWVRYRKANSEEKAKILLEQSEQSETERPLGDNGTVEENPKSTPFWIVIRKESRGKLNGKDRKKSPKSGRKEGYTRMYLNFVEFNIQKDFKLILYRSNFC